MNINKNLGIKISLFSSKQVLNFSYGRIYNSKTLKYKNFKPELKGLFCDRVFGSADKNCYCGKIYNYDDFGWICNNCGVETSLKNDNFKRYRMGYLKLYDNFINPLYYKSFPYYLSIFLNLSKKDIDRILYHNYYLILYSDFSLLKINDVISSNIYFSLKKKYYNKFHASTGIEAFYKFLNDFDFKSEILKIKNNFIKSSYKNTKKDNSLKKNIKRYNILKNFFYNKINPLNIFIKNLMVLPPDLRPMVRLPNDTIVSSDLNELYKRIINSNLRLKKIKFFFSSPLKFLLDEKKNLQNYIDNLYLGGGSYNSKPLKSLIDNLKGKTGFFRNNLLGKRVDYSGRAVIVSGANLKFGECAIPKKMAIELFRPFIYNIILKNKNFNIKTSKLEVDKLTDFSYSILINIIKNFYILLNRAPTLHKLGVQTFKILITNENVIKLHPLVCASFNADFDGDQMAAHIPITLKSSIEFKQLLYSGNNIFHPSNGACSISPNKDMVLGIYSFTKSNYFDIYNNRFFFNNIYEVFLSFNYNYINFNTIIFLRFKEYDYKFNKLIYKIYKTTFSKIIIFNFFPNNYFYEFLNKNLNKSNISKIIDFLIYKYEYNFSSNLCNNLMIAGFNLSTNYGSSISIDDMFFDFNKKKNFKISKHILTSYNLNYLNFFLNKNKKKKKFLNLWENTSNLISNNIIKNLSISNFLDSNNLFLKTSSINALHLMADSGARCSETQIKQICSSRGLINYKRHGIFDFFVLNGLRDGLNIFEYFYFSHNSRKTLADTALKTSSAGYLTRRLVEASYNIYIFKHDCNSNQGLVFKSLIHQGELIEDFFDRIFGRVTLLNFISYSKRIFIKKNTFIDEKIINILKINNINSFEIRSPLKCKSERGVCSLCYGIDLSKGKIVDIGEMVGVVAAQAIGEPGTQLTMRTFHSAGAVNILTKKSFYTSNSRGFLKYPPSLKYVLNKQGLKIVISKFSKLKIINNLNKCLESFEIPYSSYLFFENNSFVNIGDLICKWDPNYDIIVSEFSGFLKFHKFFNNLNFIKKSSNIIDDNYIEITSYKIIPNISIYNKKKCIKNYILKSGDLLMFNDNDFVNIGDIIIKHPKKIFIAEDIVGGLPKIDNLFEARLPKSKSFLSPVKGVVKLDFSNPKNIIIKILKNKNIIFSFSFNINLLSNLVVFDNQSLNKGDIIIKGDTNPHDILFLHGIDYFTDFMLEEIKYIYFSQGVKINDKHLEIIISQMLKSAVIIHPGSSRFLPGDIILIEDLEKFNNNVSSLSKKIKYDIILTGITKQSLRNKQFLSAASFQKTSFILSKAGMNCEIDNMDNLKSSVMTGELFSAGSGNYSKILKC